MGSLGEEELIQMVRDFIESSESTSSSSPSDSESPLSHSHQSPYLTLQDILLKSTKSEAEVGEKIFICVQTMGASMEQNVMKKLIVVSLRMAGYDASLCQTLCRTSWVSNFGSPKVFQIKDDYEYIDVVMEEKNGEKATRVILDMDFKSHFMLARPTATYKRLTAILPSVFVGSEEKLNKVISLLCRAAKESLKEKGLHIPPWRKTGYLQSKWLSKNCKKVSVELGVEENEGKSISTNCCPSVFTRVAAPPFVK
ncbi:hypothetical protein HS088_TW15G00953 [Tripterygium wilfordii]|uniref:Uncharacterized protein n=1 Tax=Tripterygium wilfordii TaxID=458696 RepID=A0A7J7CMZ2_TRIWF|nr:uncharacterized protein LOC119979858 [Tripterygium wilfordii]KAF5735447.1 hypothetical protein HS088_TW15G00953 [Tripterygium wilfordii]